MILSGKKIQEEVTNGNIIISPFSAKQINPNSYNYRLGDMLYEVTDAIIDPAKIVSYITHHIDENKGFVLQPGKLYLGSTKEIIGSEKYVVSLIGRSSVGRLGLFLQITADLGHVGAIHRWTLELKVVQPLKVYPNMNIGQVSFWSVRNSNSKNEIPYDGKYHLHNDPQPSKIYEELEL